MIKVIRNPDGSIRAAYSVDSLGNRVYGSDPTPLPVLGSMPTMPKAPSPSINSITDSMLGGMGKPSVDPFTGSNKPRTFDDFKNFIALNKKNFVRDFGKKEGMQRFNEVLNQVQEGLFDKLTEEEAKYVDDLKNNRVNL